MFPRPTEVWMQDIRNSVLFAHVGRSFIVAAALAAASLRSKVALHELLKQNNNERIIYSTECHHVRVHT